VAEFPAIQFNQKVLSFLRYESFHVLMFRYTELYLLNTLTGGELFFLAFICAMEWFLEDLFKLCTLSMI
jgi:hypothetical protein